MSPTQDQSTPGTPGIPGTHGPLKVVDLGRMPYAHALAVQREVNLAVSLGRDEPTLLLVEHDPVITVTHRQGAWDNLLAPAWKLDELGIDVQITDRGGDITYHGPGQLVAYPILKLNPLGLNLGSYMRMLEDVVIDVLTKFGVQGQRDPGATGVWVRGSGFGVQGSGIRDHPVSQSETLHPTPYTPHPLAKICAMGVRVRKNTTMHGLALNVTTDLSHFKTIDPCGLGGRPVTSLAELLDNEVPTMEAVKAVMVEQLQSEIDALPSGGVK